MPVGHPLTRDFPILFDINVQIPEFMSWPIGQFQGRIRAGIYGEPVPYHLIRFPPLNNELIDLQDGANTFRLTICPHFSELSRRDIQRHIAKLHDVTKLFRTLFPDSMTHPIIHNHEVALYLLKESLYIEMVQMLLLQVGVDESASTLLTFEQPLVRCTPAQPHQRTNRASSSGSGWFRPGFLVANSNPNANPNVLTVGVHIRNDRGDPLQLLDLDYEVRKEFEAIEAARQEHVARQEREDAE